MEFDGERARQHVAALTALGNRVRVRRAHQAAVQYLASALAGWDVRLDPFRAGPLMHSRDMTNLCARGRPALCWEPITTPSP